jgi:hypothetical protein
MYPMLIQSKYRIDDKRPMDKDGKDKKPWSKSTILIDIFKKKFTILNFEKILNGSIFFIISAMDCDLKDLPTIEQTLRQIKHDNPGFFEMHPLDA